METPFLLEAGRNGSDKHEATLRSVRKQFSDLRFALWVLSRSLLLAAAAGLSGAWYATLPPERQGTVREQALLASIPIVALFFTWFHIWLAIQMMFRPLKFIGLWQYRGTGVGIGWQGVVPRKSVKMAKTAYACARPYLLGPRDWFDRVNPRELAASTRPQLLGIVRAALTAVSSQHFPNVDQRLPLEVREEVVLAAVEQIEGSFAELWTKFAAILSDGDTGIDNDGMVVQVFTQNKELLNSFFLQLGEREFRFIERCGAALGFVCGLIQLISFQYLSVIGRAIFLPSTGFFLGIFTNWLAIQMCFKPVYPRPVRLCGRHLFDLQGLFLKRQPDVAVLYSKLLCDNFFEFSKVVEYLQTKPELWSRLKAVYVAHNAHVLKQTMGRAVSCLAPLAFGRQQYRSVSEHLQQAIVERLSEADELHKIASRYIAVASDVFKSNAKQMREMPPDKFEDLLHPVFKEDEWILILLGGVLGAIVGLAQVHFLSE